MSILIEVGAAPVNAFELEIIRRLMEELPSDYRVLPNLTLAGNQGGQPYEFDAIVVAPHGVYVVEMKGWRGSLRAESRADWRLPSGKIVRNPLPLNDQKARVLATALQDIPLRDKRGLTLRTPFVQSCVLIGSDETELDLFPEDRDRTLRPGELTAYLTSPRRMSTRERVGAATYLDVVETLAQGIAGRLDGRDPTPRSFGSYAICETLELEEASAVYLARHGVFRDSNVYRVRTWSLSPYLYDKAERKRRVSILRRSAEALHRVGDHPDILTLRDFGEDEGIFYEVTDWSEFGTLGTMLSRGFSRRAPLALKLELLQGIARGLAVAHGAGVFHRALSPQAVLIGPDGAPRLGGFDRSYLEGATQTVFAATQRAEDQPYQAPELRDLETADVFDNTDLYSFGVLAFEVLAGALPQWNKAEARWQTLGEASAPPPAIAPDLDTLLTALLEESPGDRFPDAETLVERLGDLLQSLAEIDAPKAVSPSAPAPTAAAPAPPPSPSAPPTGLAVGMTLDGGLTLVERLGEGAHGHVFKAHSPLLGETFTLKAADPQDPQSGDPLQEFALLKRVDHPGVIRARWAGVLPDGLGGAPYLLTAHVEGDTLGARLAQGALDPTDVAGLGRRIAQGLDAIHRAGVLHRDLKPENIFLTEGGPVIGDFSSAALEQTAGDAPVGTLRYTPPDLEAGGWDRSCDTFALGVVLYEALAGAAPWGASPPSFAIPAPLADAAPDVPASLARCVARAIAPRRADRFPSALALADALARALAPPAPRTPEPAGGEAEAERSPIALTPTLLGQLMAAESPEALLYRALTSGAEGAEAAHGDLEGAFIAHESRDLRLERVLAVAMPSLYDRLIASALPMELHAEDPAPASVPLPEGGRLLILDALSPFDLPYVRGLLRQAGRLGRERIWCPGPLGPGDRDASVASLRDAFGAELAEPSWVEDSAAVLAALSEGRRVVAMALPRGRRDEGELVGLLETRRRILRLVIEGALEAVPGPILITATWGVIYLGHGLRTDVGGLGVGGDRTRAAWAQAFPEGRRAPLSLVGGPSHLPAPVLEPTREHRGLRLAVGRLAWPQGPRAPILAAGGLSIPECILPILHVPPKTP